jgi:aquaporin Z
MLKLIVEFLGTMLLSFVIFSSGGNYVAIGVTVAIIILLGGPISGGAYNPAVAIALFYAKKLSVTDLVPYIIAEISGCVAGYEVFKMLV